MIVYYQIISKYLQKPICFPLANYINQFVNRKRKGGGAQALENINKNTKQNNKAKNSFIDNKKCGVGVGRWFESVYGCFK